MAIYTMATNPQTNFDTFVTDPDAEVKDQVLLTSNRNNPTTNTTEPALVHICESELQLAQLDDPFYVNFCRRLGKGNAFPSL